MQKIFLILLVFILALSCSEEPVVKKNNSNNTENKNTKNKSLVFDILKDIPSNYLPQDIVEYLQNKQDLTVSYTDDNVMSFVSKQKNDNSFYKIEYLKKSCGFEVLGVYSYTKDSTGYLSTFYFIQKSDNKWSNITQVIISQNILNFIKDNFDQKLKYEKQNTFYAFQVKSLDKAIIFDILNTGAIYIFDGKWDKVGSIVFKDGVLIVEENNLKEFSDSLLTNQQLEYTKKYYDIKSAYRDTTNVYVVDFSGLGIKKLDSEISQIKNVQVMILDNNYLKKLPDEICLLKKIQILSCNYNEIELLPLEIGLLSNLEELSVKGNKLQVIPSSLSKATNLKTLDLSENDLKNIVIDWSNLKNLVILNISNNNISVLPTTIGQLTNLVSIDLSNNPIDLLPEQFFDLKKIDYLNIKNTKIPEAQILRLMDSNPDLVIDMD